MMVNLLLSKSQWIREGPRHENEIRIVLLSNVPAFKSYD
jgi:hypothetical protein